MIPLMLLPVVNVFLIAVNMSPSIMTAKVRCWLSPALTQFLSVPAGKPIWPLPNRLVVFSALAPVKTPFAVGLLGRMNVRDLLIFTTGSADC